LSQTLDWENTKQLLERCVWLRVCVTVSVCLKLSNRVDSPKEIFDYIGAKIRDHRSVVIWIVPSPVRSSFIVIVENPLKALKISKKQLLKMHFAFRLLHIEIKLRVIIVSFGFVRIFLISVDKLFHEVMITLDG